MKNILSAFAVVLTLTAFSSVAQTIPKGQYVAQPNSDGSGIFVQWADGSFLRAGINTTNGLIEDLYYKSEAGYWTLGESADQGQPITKPEAWKKLATQVLGEFRLLPDGDKVGLDLYYEITEYKCTHMIQSLAHSESPAGTTTAIFEKTTPIGHKMIAFTLDRWHGPKLEMGQSLLVGQDGRSEHFFNVTKTPIGVLVSSEMKAVIEEQAKEIAALSKKG